MRRDVAVIVLGICAAACNSSAAPGSAAASVAGMWSGTLQFTHVANGAPVLASQDLSMTLAQNGATVTGTWQTLNGTVSKQGTVSGTVAATSFSGTFSFLGTTIATGATCTGTLAVSGLVGASALTWASPGVVGNCSDPPTNVTFSVALVGR